MARRDLAGATALAVLAIVYLVANRRYALDTLAAPGPGVFPLAVGVALLGLVVCQAVGAIRSRGPVEPAAYGDKHGRVLVLVALLIGYGVALHVVGFQVASFALVLLASRVLGARDWLRPGVLAAGVALAVHVIFVLWLGVPLPRGVLP